MKWSHYREAAMAFCNPETRTLPWVARGGLLSEVGELVGLGIKAREGKHVEQGDILAEIGDCCWRLAHCQEAGLCGPLELEGAAGWAMARESGLNYDRAIFQVANAVIVGEASVDRATVFYQNLLSALVACAATCGASGPTVLQMNLDKLASRHGGRSWVPHERQVRT